MREQRSNIFKSNTLKFKENPSKSAPTPLSKFRNHERNVTFLNAIE